MNEPMATHVTEPRDGKIAVIGLGHVGLPTALGFAEAGWVVIGADSAQDKVRMLATGQAPFYEPGLQEQLQHHLRSGRFRLALSTSEAIGAASVVFVCVGTPLRGDGTPDSGQIEAVARDAARHLNGYKLIVEKSTIPVRSADRIKQTLHRYANSNHEFDVAVNPEFLQESTALHDVLHPDRIIIGVESDRARDILVRIYHPILSRIPQSGECEICDRLGRNHGRERRLVVTDPPTAELIKHAANAFLSTKISFINMIAELCDAAGADVTKIAHAIGLDPRIGPQFLRAGVGFGGYCLPKDLRALMHTGVTHGVDISLLREVDRINQRQADRLLDKVRRALWVIDGKTISVLGLAFKPETDDIREAASLKIVPALLAEGASIRLHDPQAMRNFQRVVAEQPERLVYCGSPYEAATGAHAIVLLTDWEEYRALDLGHLRRLMEIPVFIDGRNMFDAATMRAMGFEYCGFGNIQERRRIAEVIR